MPASDKGNGAAPSPRLPLAPNISSTSALGQMTKKLSGDTGALPQCGSVGGTGNFQHLAIAQCRHRLPMAPLSEERQLTYEVSGLKLPIRRRGIFIGRGRKHAPLDQKE